MLSRYNWMGSKSFLLLWWSGFHHWPWEGELRWELMEAVGCSPPPPCVWPTTSHNHLTNLGSDTRMKWNKREKNKKETRLLYLNISGDIANRHIRDISMLDNGYALFFYTSWKIWKLVDLVWKNLLHFPLPPGIWLLSSVTTWRRSY